MSTRIWRHLSCRPQPTLTCLSSRPKAEFRGFRFITRKQTFRIAQLGGYDGQPECSGCGPLSYDAQVTLSTVYRSSTLLAINVGATRLLPSNASARTTQISLGGPTLVCEPCLEARMVREGLSAFLNRLSAATLVDLFVELANDHPDR